MNVSLEALRLPGLRTLVAVPTHQRARYLAYAEQAWCVTNQVGARIHAHERLDYPNGSRVMFRAVYTAGEAMRRLGATEWQRMYLDPALDPEIREYLCSRLRSANPKVPVLGAVNLDEADVPAWAEI